MSFDEKAFEMKLEEHLLNFEEGLTAFLNNPLNLANNKRRMKGLKPLRGSTNKDKKKRRLKFYCSYRNSILRLIEDAAKDYYQEKDVR